MKTKEAKDRDNYGDFRDDNIRRAEETEPESEETSQSVLSEGTGRQSNAGREKESTGMTEDVEDPQLYNKDIKGTEDQRADKRKQATTE